MKNDKELKPAVIIGENDLATTHPEIYNSLDDKLNIVFHVNLKTLTAYSDDYVYLWCEKIHLYMARVFKAVDGSTTCPFCKGLREWPEGETIIVKEKDEKGEEREVVKPNPLFIARQRRIKWLEEHEKGLKC